MKIYHVASIFIYEGYNFEIKNFNVIPKELKILKPQVRIFFTEPG